MAGPMTPNPTPSRIEEALAFDDVLVVPAYSQVLPASVSTRTRLTRTISLHIPLISSAMDQAERHVLRGYDSVQLAAAIQVHSEFVAHGAICTLVSADAELNAAALAEGLTVENPNAHP